MVTSLKCVLLIFITIFISNVTLFIVFRRFYIPNQQNVLIQHKIVQTIRRSSPSSTTFKPECNVVTFQSMGRLGNNLFQFAAAYSIAKHTGRRLLLVDNPYLSYFHRLKQFSSTDSLGSWRKKCNVEIVFEHGPMEYTDFTQQIQKQRKSIALVGYFQNYRYFWDIRHQLISLLEFNTHVMSSVNRYLNKIRVKHKNKKIVGIHIRRSDMATSNSGLRGYVPASKSYLLQAVQWMEQAESTGVVFVVCSDGMAWAKTFLKDTDRRKFYFYQGDVETDLYLLSQCDNLVLTVGTFSWWSGFLNKSFGKVVYQRQFYKNNTDYGKAVGQYYEFPKAWIAL